MGKHLRAALTYFRYSTSGNDEQKPITMNSKQNTNTAQRQHAARRTAMILAIIAVAFFVLSLVQQFVIVHRH